MPFFNPGQNTDLASEELRKRDAQCIQRSVIRQWFGFLAKYGRIRGMVVDEGGHSTGGGGNNGIER